MLTPSAANLVRALAEMTPGQAATSSTLVSKTLPAILPLPPIPQRVGVGAPTLN
jgi:hypothetical protein